MRVRTHTHAHTQKERESNETMLLRENNYLSESHHCLSSLSSKHIFFCKQLFSYYVLTGVDFESITQTNLSVVWEKYLYVYIKEDIIFLIIA